MKIVVSLFFILLAINVTRSSYAGAELDNGYKILQDNGALKNLMNYDSIKKAPSYCRDKVPALEKEFGPYKDATIKFGLGDGNELNHSYYDYCITANKVFDSIRNTPDDIRRLFHIFPLTVEGVHTGISVGGKELVSYTQRQNIMVYTVGTFDDINEQNLLTRASIINFSAEYNKILIKPHPKKYKEFMRALFTNNYKLAVKIIREQPTSNWNWDDYRMREIPKEGPLSVLSVCKAIRDSQKKYSLENLVNMLGIPNVQWPDTTVGSGSLAWTNGLMAEYKSNGAAITVQECPLHKLEPPSDDRFDAICKQVSQAKTVTSVKEILGDTSGISGGRDIVSGTGIERLFWESGFSILVYDDDIISMPCK